MADHPHRLSRLLYVPPGSIANAHANSYSRQMARACELVGLHAVPSPIRSPAGLVRALRLRRSTVALVNWLENTVVDEAGRFSLRGAFKYFRRLLKLRLLAAVVLYVEHNRYPHHTQRQSRAIVTRTMQLGQHLFADRIVTHDDGAGCRTYLPHPSYPLHLGGRSPAASGRVACFGIIAPRKGLEDLVACWSGDHELLIAGYARDRDYLRRLQALATGKNIAFRTDELSDDEAAQLLAGCIAVVVVNSSPSTIVSGSLYFALSCGVPVVAVGLEHARRLAATATPGVHFVGSLDRLAAVDWRSIAKSDRRRIYEHVHQTHGVDAVADRIVAALKEIRP